MPSGEMMARSSSRLRERFGSRFASIVAAIGMAVGTGNMWRFPRVACEWEDGTFTIALVIAFIVRAVTLPGAAEGLRYLFVPEWSRPEAQKSRGAEAVNFINGSFPRC
jgi:SNF family Na+-dependent transporter